MKITIGGCLKTVGVVLLILLLIGFGMRVNQVEEAINGNFEYVYDNVSQVEKDITNISEHLLKNRKDYKKAIDNLKGIDVEKMKQRIVRVHTGQTYGTGVIVKKIDNKMYILTCHHVVENILLLAETLELNMKKVVTIQYYHIDKSGEEVYAGMVSYRAFIIEHNEKYDLALLEVRTIDDNLEVIEIADTEPKVGTEVYAIGEPVDTHKFVSKGIISNNTSSIIFNYMDAVVTYGSSGGGVINQKGQLVGIVSRCGKVYGDEEKGFVPESGMSKIVKVKHIRTFLDKSFGSK